VLLYKRPCSDLSVSPDVDGKNSEILSRSCGRQKSTADGNKTSLFKVCVEAFNFMARPLESQD
jgi:hypothetical protein